MTSRERLERVANYLEKSAAPDIADEIRKCLPDLEVFEMLKKYVGIEVNDTPIFDDNSYPIWLRIYEDNENDCRTIFVTTHEKDLLKKWLKNNNVR